MDTLDDLGAQLRALSSGQPAQPGNRVPGVTRRAGRIRRTRAALAVGASLAVLAPAGLLVTSAQHHQDTTFARSDLLTWPDRSVEADKGIGDGAVAALGQSTGADVAKVRWLYRARVRMPVPNPAYVAVFTAEVQGQDLLVVATSFGHELDSSGLTTDDETPVASWDTDDRTVLEPGKPLTHVGAYLPYTLGDVHSSFAVVLADARARTLTWTYAPLPFAPPVSTGVGPAPVPSRNGVFLVDLQAITGPATVTVSDSEGHRASGPLASGTSQPNLTVPDAPALPPTWRAVLSTQGQTERHSTGGWATPSFSSAPSGTSQRVQTAIVRCYGGGTLHVTLKLGEKGVLAAEGDVPCDGESHQAFAAVDVGDVQEHLEVRGDRLQVMNLAFGSLS